MPNRRSIKVYLQRYSRNDNIKKTKPIRKKGVNMASVKDLKLNPPKKKTELTKTNMLKFIKEYGSVEEKKWFIELLEKNTLKKKNNLKGGAEIEGYDLPVIREEFAKAFFPDISSYEKNKKKKNSHKPTFADEIEQLKKELGE